MKPDQNDAYVIRDHVERLHSLKQDTDTQIGLLQQLEPWIRQVNQKMAMGLSRREAVETTDCGGLTWRLLSFHAEQVAMIAYKLYLRLRPEAYELEDVLSAASLVFRYTLSTYQVERGSSFGVFIGSRLKADIRDYLVKSAGGGVSMEQKTDSFPVDENGAMEEPVYDGPDLQEKILTMAEMIDEITLKHLMKQTTR
jgi:hypothetical protein